MSSFYVGHKQVSAIANALQEIAPELDSKTWGAMPRDSKTLARSLYELNRFALKERYPQSYEQMIPEPFEYSSDSPLSTAHNEEAQLYKSIECFLYQCSEGYAPEQELYKQIETLNDALAHRIAMRWADAMGARWE